MMHFAKQWVLRSLDQAGYRLLKKADHDALQAAAVAAQGAPATCDPSSPSTRASDPLDVLEGSTVAKPFRCHNLTPTQRAGGLVFQVSDR